MHAAALLFTCYGGGQEIKAPNPFGNTIHVSYLSDHYLSDTLRCHYQVPIYNGLPAGARGHLAHAGGGS
jgi:hypothetical protein